MITGKLPACVHATKSTVESSPQSGTHSSCNGKKNLSLPPPVRAKTPLFPTSSLFPVSLLYLHTEQYITLHP